MENHQYRALMDFGNQALKKEGNRQAAKKFFERASKSGSTESLIKLAEVTWTDSPEETIQLLSKIECKTPQETMDWARANLQYSSWYNRMKQGLMPYHVTHWSEFGFDGKSHAWRQYFKAIRNAPPGNIDSACVYFLHTGRKRDVFAKFDGHVMGTVDFDNIEFEWDGLPRGAKTDPAIWLGCDEKYLAFADPLVRSIKSHGIDPFLFKFDEHPKGALYYHAARFIRLWEWMKEHDRPVWMMDVDAICNRDPQELFSLMGDSDVAMRGRPCRLEPWNQLNACVVGFNNTPHGKAYLSAIANFVQKAIDADSLAWGIDQVAMLCAVEKTRPSVTWLDDKAVDYDYQDEGLIWCNSGRNKWRHLQPAAVDPDRQKYLTAFQRWCA